MHPPTVPHVPIPHVPLPPVDVHDMTARMHGLAASAAERIEDLPDRAAALAGTVVPLRRPAPKRSKRPVALVAAAVVAMLAVAWFLRSRRRASEQAGDIGTTPATGEPSVSAVS